MSFFPKENNKRRGSRRKRSRNPRQREFDRSLSRTGRDRSIKRDGTGRFNWGSIRKSRQEVNDLLEEMKSRAQYPTSEQKITMNKEALLEEEVEPLEEEWEWEHDSEEQEFNQEEEEGEQLDLQQFRAEEKEKENATSE